MGRRPKSTAQKKLEGNPGHRALNPDEPIAKVGLPPPPDFLRAEEKRFYRKLGDQLVAEKRMAIVYQPTFVVLVQAWGRVAQASRELKKAKPIVKTSTGYPIQNPWYAILSKSQATMMKAADALGITPTSQSKVGTVKKPGSVTKLQDFIGRRGRKVP